MLCQIHEKIKHVYFQARRNGATQGCIAIYLRKASRLQFFSRGMFRLPTTEFLQLKFKNRLYLRKLLSEFRQRPERRRLKFRLLKLKDLLASEIIIFSSLRVSRSF